MNFERFSTLLSDNKDQASNDLRSLAQKVESYAKQRLDVSLSVDKRVIGELCRILRISLLPDNAGNYQLTVKAPEGVDILIYYSPSASEKEDLDFPTISIKTPDVMITDALIDFLAPEYSKTVNEPNPFHPVPVIMRERKRLVMGLSLIEAEKLLIAVRECIAPPNMAGRPRTFSGLSELKTSLENGIRRSLCRG
jgi:hypothetical protein